MRAWRKEFERKLLWLTPLKRFVVPRYQYSFSPSQLAFLNRAFVDSHGVQGVSVEIGCFVGATSVFLNANYRYGVSPRDYYALDTFSGFTKEDLRFEAQVRHKDLKGIHDTTLFQMNSQGRFDYTMKVNGFTQVKSVKLDVNTIDQWPLTEPVAFCLLDVDLYRPTRKALEFIVPRMQRGGVLIVDDCVPNSGFDGSLQALREISAALGFEYQIIEGKLGVVRC